MPVYQSLPVLYIENRAMKANASAVQSTVAFPVSVSFPVLFFVPTFLPLQWPVNLLAEQLLPLITLIVNHYLHTYKWEQLGIYVILCRVLHLKEWTY